MTSNNQPIDEKVKNILLYVGSVAALVAGIAYVGVTYVIVQGFESALDRDKQILFSALGAAFGIIISMLLRSQGVSLAKRLQESQDTMREYYSVLNKTKSIKKLRTIKFYMVFNTIKDMFTKAAGIGISTYLVIYIFSEGNGDYSLFLLALSNICMFIGFGFIALAKTYDFYVEEHIPAIKEITIKLKEQQNIDQVGSIQPEGEEDALYK